MHKLGRAVELVTRASDSAEVVVVIDWDELERSDYLSDAALRVVEREPLVFADRTGTRITVNHLREPWTRGMARSLRRSVTAMTSPFEEVSSFRPRLVLKPDADWFDGLLDPARVLESAVFHATATIDPDAWTMSYAYEFTPPDGSLLLAPRLTTKTDVPPRRRRVSE